MRKLLTFMGVVLALWVLFALWVDYQGSDIERRRESVRALRAQSSSLEDPIQVAIVWPATNENELFIRGIKLAGEALNENGVLHGRKLKFVFYEEKPEIAR